MNLRTGVPTRLRVAGVNRATKRKDQGRVSRLIAFACGVAALSSMLAAHQSSASGQNPPSPTNADFLPDGPGKAVVAKACLSCHNAKIATSKAGTEDEWADVVNQMIGKGALLSDDEADQVVEYLAKHFGPPDAKDGSTSAPSAAAPSPEKTATPPASAAAAPPPSASSAPTVNVNRAGVEELTSSLGLSDAEAKAIIQYREQHGNFKTWQDMASVPGVSTEKIKDKQNLITF